MINAYYQKTKITEKSLRPSAILRLRIFSTLVFLLIPVFTMIKFTELLPGIGTGLEWGVSIVFVGCLIVISLSRLANMLMFTDKHLDEWEIRVKKRAEAFGFRFALFSMMFLAFVFSFQYESLLDRQFTYQELVFVPVTIFFYLAILPILYVAWTQKPLDDSEDIESLSEIVV